MTNPEAIIVQQHTVRFHQVGTTGFGGMLLGGEWSHHPGHLIPPMEIRRWPTYSLVYVLEGVGEYADDAGVRQTIGPGDLMQMLPDHGYAYQIASDCLWSELYIQFHGPVFDLLRQHQVLDPRRPIRHLVPLSYWAERLRHLFRPLEPEIYAAPGIHRACELQLFLADAFSGNRNTMDGHDDAWLARARERLDELALDRDPDWTAVAGDLGLSVERFRRKFTQLSGQTPFSYLANRSIGHACELLQDSELRVKEVAQRCGFADEYHFSRRFKQLVGLSPRQFRTTPRHR